jgi:hypothetical protein
LRTLRIEIDAAADRAWFAHAPGALVAQARSPWADATVALHEDLHLARTGGIVLMRLTGAAPLSSLISGILAHSRIYRGAFHSRIGGPAGFRRPTCRCRAGAPAENLTRNVLPSLPE